VPLTQLHSSSNVRSSPEKVQAESGREDRSYSARRLLSDEPDLDVALYTPGLKRRGMFGLEVGIGNDRHVDVVAS